MDPRRNKVDWVTPLCTVYEKLGKKMEADELRPRKDKIDDFRPQHTMRIQPR